MKRKLLEILPGFLAWFSLGLLVLFSFIQPVWVAIFIIFFDCYWLFKTIFLYLHLQVSFKQMRLNQKINWLEGFANLRDYSQIYHLVILPTYQEPHAVVRESFLNLKAVNYPKDKIIVVLGIEERAGETAKIIAQEIKNEFEKDFFKFLVVSHPANRPGEIAGKGANETWALKEAKKSIIDPLRIPYENILVSALDVDTQVGPEYFGILTYKFLTAENPQRSSYQPIPLFTNNIYQAPAFARVIAFSTTFWMMMRQSWPERLTTFSSHATPFKGLVEIGFWPPNIVSEDSRVFWQCFLHYNGDWRVVPLLYPVQMDANVAPTFWGTIKNLYKQQRRWAWGVENVPYALSGFSRKIPWRQKLYRGFHLIEDCHSWATNSLIIFIFGWLPVIVGGEKFNITLLSYNLPWATRWIMAIASVGIIISAILALGLLPPKPKNLKFWHHPFFYLIQWLLMPLTLIILGSLPALEAQTRLMLPKRFHLDFWTTPKSRSKTSG